MSHMVNGKETKVGDKVTYTHPNGEKYESKILEIEPKNGTHYTRLETKVDGKATHFTSVPHHPDGIGHTWDHAQ